MDKRSEKARARFSLTELATMKGKAEALDVTLSEFVRAAALAKEVPDRKTGATDPKILAELRRIGIEVNQMARVLNSGGEINMASFKAICGELDAILDVLATQPSD